LFLSVDKEWEVKYVESQAGAFRSLPVGKAMSSGFSYSDIFFVQGDLGDKIKTNWDNMTAKPIINRVIVE